MNQRLQAEIKAISAKLLSRFPDGQIARIFLRATYTSSMRQVWASEGAPEVVGMDGERIIGTVEKRQRSVLVYDAAKDSLLRGVEVRRFQSCLCVPVFDEYKFLVGLLFVASERASAFSADDRLEVERLARESSKLSPTEPGQKPPPPADASGGTFELLMSTPVKLGAILLLIFLTLAAIGPAKIADAPPPQTERVELTPAETVAKFAQHLRVGEFAVAWQMMHPSLQERASQNAFVSEFQNWSSEPRNQRSLLSRRMPVVKVEGERATATFHKPEGAQGESDWIWELSRDKLGWSITSLKGPIDRP